MADQWYIPDDTNEEEAAVTCRICSRFFTDARSLECGDNFCFCCIKRVQQSEEKIACPVCTTVCVPAMMDLHSLQPNVDLNGKVSAVMQPKGWSNLCILKSIYVTRMHVHSSSFKF